MFRNIKNFRFSSFFTKFIDHINGVTSDNRIVNLRECNESENSCNVFVKRGSSKYKGVSFRKETGKWLVHITKERKVIYIGSFDNETAASEAYKKNCKIHHKEFAKTEFSKAQKAMKMWVL